MSQNTVEPIRSRISLKLYLLSSFQIVHIAARIFTILAVHIPMIVHQQRGSDLLTMIGVILERALRNAPKIHVKTLAEGLGFTIENDKGSVDRPVRATSTGSQSAHVKTIFEGYSPDIEPPTREGIVSPSRSEVKMSTQSLMKDHIAQPMTSETLQYTNTDTKDTVTTPIERVSKSHVTALLGKKHLFPYNFSKH